jgi:hypothetical protein
VDDSGENPKRWRILTTTRSLGPGQLRWSVIAADAVTTVDSVTTVDAVTPVDAVTTADAVTAADTVTRRDSHDLSRMHPIP